ncbi:NtaA/DmoA family FMN-dependent monooxygenase [Ancylobacter sp. Lp-2]|uniref:NtaA/DmoA family FMN-dependent monooxygenase n=1 Tax=Ancylobacter sp. Lp-2 TaxID=2881339 RepID=UPI001E61E86D|nr:NtaA/DmoA family FMN-dependent monooxygenase [Ancylobacter sp. Lp-2]MCB4771463.1 NtaA/DmoA family FMN-dependent monooxygenase [Ancylobacter sp. Lp-2]
MPSPFHLSWFLQGSSAQAWGEPWTGNIGSDWMSAEIFVDLARAIERACFDYLLIEDSIFIGESWNNSRDIFLNNGICVPRQEPSVVATLLAASTKRLGIVPTLSTFAYAPYLTARIIGSLDQISGGRAGWNLVTGFADLAARNFGLDGMADHEERYQMAEEYVAVVKQLWDSWEPGAIRDDRENGILVDPAKVRTIDYAGKYYSSRRPLNSGPCPQGRPVIAQAGGSSTGRTFAATHADTIVAAPTGIENMKRYRQEVRAQMAALGRDPDSCKLLFLLSPIIAETEEQARWYADQRGIQAVQNIETRLARLGWAVNIDFSAFDLDAPVGELSTNGTQSTLQNFLIRAGKNTLREAVIANSSVGYCVDVVGTPDSAADQMREIMEEVGGDGFLIVLPDVSRRSIATITDGLVPALQRRGLARKAYEHAHLRDNLLAF